MVLLAFFNKGDLRDDPEGTAVVVRRLRKVAPQAEEKGIVLGIESWLSAEDHVRILDEVGSPNVQVYYDVSNSTIRGYDIYREIRLLGSRRICEFHAKDGNSLLGEGKVDFPRVREALEEIGYRGWIIMEASRPKGVVPSYKANLEYLKTFSRTDEPPNPFFLTLLPSEPDEEGTRTSGVLVPRRCSETRSRFMVHPRDG